MEESAWKTEDKVWMKKRRAGWKDVKKSLDVLTGVRTRDKKFLKDFYMTGNVDIDAMIKVYGRRAVAQEKLLQPMDAPVLLECWLSADQSDESWQHIREKYADWELMDSRRRFLETLDYYPESGAFFGGLEERLYRFLCPTRCRPEDYPSMNKIQYQEQSRRVWAQITRNIEKYFETKHPNPNNFIPYRLNEWIDSFVPTWELRGEDIFKYVSKIISKAHIIKDTSDKYDSSVVELSSLMLELLSKRELPENLRYLSEK